MSLTLRLDKGSALSYAEMDGNFTFLSSSSPSIDTSVFATTGSNEFSGDQSIIGSLSQGYNTQTIGKQSHAEGGTTISGIQAYYSDNILNGQIIIAGYGDVTSYFLSDSYLILDDFDNYYGTIKLQVSQSYVNSGNTVIELYDNSINAAEALIGSYNYAILPNSDYTVGNYSHAEGEGPKAIGAYSHAEGSYTVATGQYSHAEGNTTETIGYASHAEGYNTQALGDFSHAEGDGARAIGSYSHAEGDTTEAIGNYSHAEGEATETIGYASHAEGYYTQAIGNYSHAEGEATETIGYASHAEGASSQAIGAYSHAEGASSQAIGNYSHAEGWGTIASGSYQHVSGKYNTHGDDTSLFIVGNGTNDNRSIHRSDAFKVRQSGSIVLPVTSSATPGWTGTNGEIIFGDDGVGNYVIWAYLGGAWRSGSLV